MPHESASKHYFYEMPQTRPTRTWDLVLSIVLLIGVVALAGVALIYAIFIPTASAGCGGDCNLTQFETGFALSLALPVLVTIATLVVTIVRLVKRRLAFWVPLAGAAGVGLGVFIGAAVAFTAIPNFF